MNDFITAAVALGTAIIGLALVAVLVSRNSATPQVIQAFGNAFSSAIKEAVSPISAGNSLALSGS